MTGCATVPSPQIQAEVTVPFDLIVRQPDQYIGQTVTLGGYVLETQNRQGETVLNVLQAPLDSHHKPKGQDLSQGRFLARTSSFLDPEVYSKNRQVTLTGKVSSVQPQKLGDRMYPYPVVDIQGLYLWPRFERRVAPYYPYYNPYGSGPWYDPWYPPYRYGPFRHYPWW